jgi:hypothetical protein
MSDVHISSPTEDTECYFRLDSLHDVPAPEGCEGTWQRYVIVQGNNRIVGMRAGLQSEVSKVVSDYIERLNLRFAKQKAKAAR